MAARKKYTILLAREITLGISWRNVYGYREVIDIFVQITAAAMIHWYIMGIIQY